MATIRERRPDVWEVRLFTGTGPDGRPTQLSKTVHGGKREAQRVAAEMTVGLGPHCARRSVGERRARCVGRPEPRHVGAVVGTRPAESGARHQEGPDRQAAARPPVRRRRRALAHPAARKLAWATPASRTNTVSCGLRSPRRSAGDGSITNVAGHGPPALDEARSVAPSMTLDEVRAVMAAAAVDRPRRRAHAPCRCGLRRPPRRARRAAVGRPSRRAAHDRLGDRDRLERRRRPRVPRRRDEDRQHSHRHARPRHRRGDRGASGRAGAVRPVDVRSRPRPRQPRPHRLVVEAGTHHRRRSTPDGGCTTSDTGRRRWRSARATTSARSPAAWGTPTRP